MNFKGGVILIGSLFWEDTSIREKWRRVAFKNSLNPILVPVNIRYGRQPSTRKNTYTMILSNHPSTKPGQGIILELKNAIKNFKNLSSQAYALAHAEGICKDLLKPTLISNWGAIGLLLNPSIDKKDFDNSKLIRELWSGLYSPHTESFSPDAFKIHDDEPNIIDESGFVSIEWTKEMNEFDLLLVTVARPNPKTLATPLEIATKIEETGYEEYFKKNREHGIFTFQDNEVIKLLNQGAKAEQIKP